MRTVQTDVVVIGGGGAGLAAAIEARSLGREVVLLEKNARLGGSTAMSVGSVTASNTPHQLRKGIKDCPDHHFEDIGRYLDLYGFKDNQDNLALRRVLVDNVPETFRWLMSMGVEFYGPLPEPPHRKPRMHNVLPNSAAFIYHLGRRARKTGVDIRTAARARSLLSENGRVVGVLGDAPEGTTEFQARGGVVLATGDFGGNPEMRVKYVSPALDNIQAINPTNTGDGHEMALALGGRLVNPEIYLAGIRFQHPPYNWITALPPIPFVAKFINYAMEHFPGSLLRPFVMSFLTTVLLPSPQLYASGAILINKRGERFADERALAKAGPLLAQQPDQCAYMLLDGRVAEKFSGWPHYVSTAPGVAFAYIPDYRRNRKDVFREAQTLAALADKLGVPAPTLEKTVAEYNASAVKHGDKARVPLDRGPYVALGPLRYYINFTDSGMAVNDKLQVLGPGERPIEGLFAAGFIGMGGVILKGHGHHLGWAFTSGRLAGRYAAHRVVSADLPAGEGHAY